MPTKTPSNLSRDKSGYSMPPPPPLHDPFTSILGKRSSLEPPPENTKRHAAATPFEKIQEEGHLQHVDQYSGQSPSQNSAADNEDVAKHDLLAFHGQDSSIVKSSPNPRPKDHPHFPPKATGDCIFQDRHIRRRRSAPTIGHISKMAKDDVTAAYRDNSEYLNSNARQISIIYRVRCNDRHKSHFHETFFFEDDPIAAHLESIQKSSHLAGRKPVYQLHSHLRLFQHTSFVIFKDRPCSQGLYSRSSDDYPETILVVDNGLQNFIQQTVTSPLRQFIENGALEICAPYQPLYFDRQLLGKSSQSMNPSLRGEVEALLAFVVDHYGHEYEEADRLLSEHRTKVRHLDKIFKLNEIIVEYHPTNSRLGSEGKQFRNASVVQTWPKKLHTQTYINVWNWERDFDYERSSRQRVVGGLHTATEESFSIRELDMVPISILSNEELEHLRQRGKKSWDLRHPRFVYHSGNSKTKPGRYMIDHEMHHRLHPTVGAHHYIMKGDPLKDPWKAYIGLDEVPDENDYLIMPDEISGYEFHEKEWVRLPVTEIQSIRWSKLPFEHLVLPVETKRLVKALVTVRASSIKKKHEEKLRASFDIIPGKGNGLIMLFHGSPGTGKTLTAESVAEIAEMPLYPITCGDIGTDPEKVEQYLQLVFELGMRWNCVLLLDEADVFLEERTLTDLQRNSLVSVFLRMLEYYEGILILTSNRVGTFDEAFRSRIHIALHYEDLTLRSRKQIWQNFLGRLEDTEEGENLEEIRDKLNELAHHKLNGREIRNALSTARQLASHENQKVGWDHLQLAIKTIDKFGAYLKDVHGHSDRDWAKERRER